MSTSMLQAIVANLTASPPKEPMRPAADGHVHAHGEAGGAVQGSKGGSTGGAPEFLSRRSSLGEDGPGSGSASASSHHEAFAKALLLAVRWDRPEIAKPILAEIEARGMGFAKGTMQRALQAAISLERLELLRLFVASPGFEVLGLPGTALAQPYP